MVVYWLLSGLVSGIIAAHFLGKFSLIFAFLGLFFLCLLSVRTRKVAVFSLFLSLGFAFTLLRISYSFSPNYGQSMDYTVKSHRLIIQGEDYAAWQGKVLEPTDLAGATILIYSESYKAGVYTLKGSLYPPVHYRNPGQGWHFLRKVYAGEIGVLNNPHINQSREYRPYLVERWRNSLRQRMLANMGHGDGASLALALITGDRSLLGGQLRKSVYLTGVGHILALSGLHISILTALILLALKALGISRRMAGIISMVLLFFYVVMVGPSPSLIRAVLMSAYATAAMLSGRERHGLQALLWSAAAMLVFNPLWLYDYAFVFSFLATYICLTVGLRLEKHLCFLPSPIARAASMTLIIQAVALPLTMYLFGSFSLWSPLANMVIVPLMPLMAGFSLLAGLPGMAGRVLSMPAELLLSGVADFVKLMAEFPLSISLGGYTLALLAGGSVILFIFLYGRGKQLLPLFLAICVVCCCLWTVTAQATISVWFLDVGQGDAILLRNRGAWILVDCGDTYAGERAVVPALAALGVSHLQAVIVTHPHEDHAGGLQAVLSEFTVGKILVNADFLDSQWGEVALGAQVVRGSYFLADNIQIYSHNIPLHNENNGSLLVSLTAPGGKLLLTGDLEGEGELLYQNRLGRHEVLKVAHHGSRASTQREFLHSVQPTHAVISCGLANRYDFPHEETLERLNRSGANIFRTDVHGYVCFRFWPWQRYTITTFMGR